MACRYTYKGKTYEAHEFDDVLKALPLAEAAKFMPDVSALPAAPFINKTPAWTGLALKRMIRYAADNGFDAVAWTNGEQQADRYDMSKQVDAVHVQVNDNGTLTVSVDAHGNRKFIHMDVDENGKVVFADSWPELHGKLLSDVIGKEVSDKVMAATSDRSFDGLDLKVGGEGMRAFYDKIVPGVARDVLKKLGGGTVGTVGVDIEGRGQEAAGYWSEEDNQFVPTGEVTPGNTASKSQPGFYLTDVIKARANEGMPMFAGIERDRTVIDTANRRVEKFVDEFVAGRMKDGYTQIIGPTPTALQAVGAPALDMQIDGALVRKVLDGKHADGMSPDLFKAMAEGLYNPLAVFDSPDENGKPGMLALTEAVDRKGEPVIISVHMERAPHRVKINDVASMYGLERAEKRLAKMKLLYVRNDKGPAPSTTPAGPYMAGMVQAARGRGEIVLTERDVVNRFGPSFDRLDDGPTTPLPGLGTVTRQRIGDHLRAAFDSSRTFNPWHRTVGTQFHKAWVDDHFRPVFEETQQFLFDTSQFTMDAADHAPGLLPRLERLWDAVKHVKENLSPSYRKDVEAVSKAIFEGTLANRREPPDGLSARQRTLFDQARAAIDASLDSLSVSVAANQLMILNLSSRKGGRGNAVPPAMIEAMKRLPGEAEGAFNSALEGAERMAAEEYQKAIDASAIARGTPQAERASAEANAAESWLQTVRKAQKDIGRVFEKADKLKAEGYAPLMRFGRYTVTMRNPDGGVEWFSMHESEADAKGRARELAEEFPGNRIESAVMSQERWKLFRGVSPETLSIFADEAGLLDDEAMQKYLQIAVSNRSALKRLIHRKGRAGYDEDIQRVLSAFILSNARMASRNYHFGKMTEAASAIPEGKGDVADEATKLVEYVQNPEEEAGALRGLLFVNYLGGSVASALVNMTQPVTMTLPYLSQFGGIGKAVAALSAGARIASGASRPDADLAAAIKRATDEGLIAPHEIHQLQAEAIRNFGSNPLVRSGMMVWGSLFSMAEQFNRRVTFVAAFDVARGMGLTELRQRGFSSPFQFAEQAVEDTQGIYNRGNRPNWARGAVGATVFCVDDSTEALTQRGWLGPDDIKAGDMLATFDMVEQRLKWAPAKSIHVFDHDGDMVHATSKTLDMLMTPDHRVVRYKRGRVVGGKRGDTGWTIGIDEAKDVQASRRVQIPTSAEFDHQPSGEPVRNAVVPVLGWVIAEGYFDPHGNTFIYQNAGAKADAIRADLSAAGIEWTESKWSYPAGNGKHVRFFIRKSQSFELRALLPSKSLSADLLMRMSKEQIETLVDRMLLGDGSVNTNGARSLIQNPGETLESFQMALTILGKSFSVRAHGPACRAVLIREPKKNAVGRYSVSKKETVHYKGRVWCPIIPETSTWVARRNGMPFITHNTFKQFSISYLEFLKRLPPKERALALAILVLAAGLQGLPFADDLEDLIDTIGQSLGYRTNSKRALRELAVRTLGEPFGKFLVSGASAIPGVPLDVQGRLGMGNLIPGTGSLKRSDTNRGDDALEVIGPVGGLIKSAGGAVQSALRGDVTGALAGLAPVAAQNAMKAVDMWQTGQYRDRGSRNVVAVTGGDVAIKALGFQPSRVAKVQRTAREVQQDIALVRQVENEITAKWAQGRAENDQGKIDEARAQLRDWNEKNPGFPIRVQASQITRRVNEMRSERAGRLMKSAPREVRRAVAEELEE